MFYIDQVIAWPWAKAVQISSSFLGGDRPAEVDGNRGRKAEYDPRFTDSVIAATGRDANPRLKEIMPSLIRHMHDFAREVDLTVAEWMAGVEMVSASEPLSGFPVSLPL